MSIVKGVHQLWYGPDLVHVHGRRERRALMLGSAFIFVMGVGRIVFYLTD